LKNRLKIIREGLDSVEDLEIRPSARKDEFHIVLKPVAPLRNSVSNGFSTGQPIVAGDGMIYQENDDFCDDCNDGGDLICCDMCVRSFHPECLGLEDDPEDGLWYCPYCLDNCKDIIDDTELDQGQWKQMWEVGYNNLFAFIYCSLSNFRAGFSWCYGCERAYPTEG
jgi:hypothetical protein